MHEFSQLLTHSEIHRQNVSREIRAGGAVQFRHDLGCLGDIGSADDSVKPFAAADRAESGSKFEIEIDRAELLRAICNGI